MTLNHDPADNENPIERAEHYRGLARELRAVAALVQSPDTKQQLHSTAESYERIAQSIIRMNNVDERLHSSSHSGHA